VGKSRVAATRVQGGRGHRRREPQAMPTENHMTMACVVFPGVVDQSSLVSGQYDHNSANRSRTFWIEDWPESASAVIT
jgi:hypothetical protein